MTKPLVVLGFLGTTLDAGRGFKRWRPTVSLCRQPDLPIRRLELLRDPRFEALSRRIEADVREVSPGTEVRARDFPIRDPWDFEEVYGALHDFARAYPWNDAEDYLVHITTGTHVAQICLFLLTETRRFPARLVQTGPPDRCSLIDLDLSKYDRLASRFRREQREGLSTLKGGIDTRNAAFNRLIERIEHVAAASKEPMLLTGPTGAGKSLLAKRIFELKKARHTLEGPFVEVNCAVLRGDQAMSTLFGHVKGAFTGAAADRPGLLRAAHGGLLFLDEIGELGLDEQAMLLRALEEKRFLPLGADREAGSDFQLVAGTNRDLRTSGFRPDLLARINLWTFALPALRERPEDIEPNFDYELDRQGVRTTCSREARDRFLAFAKTAPWPGNFRDLAGAVARMATLAPGGRITPEIVAEEVDRLRGQWTTEDVDPSLDLFDRVQLEAVLDVCRRSSSLSEAGRILFAASRAKKKAPNDADRLRKYLARFGLRFEGVNKLI
jgi:transcriptional regulatory protein RtcR